MHPEPVHWWYHTLPFGPMPELPRRKHCASCGQLLEAGTPVFTYRRYRGTRSPYEKRVYGTGYAPVPMAPLFHCEPCGRAFQLLATYTSTPRLNGNVAEQIRVIENGDDPPRRRYP